ncbi:helix-turn-helix domain-containing protein [Salinirubellus sp. GCM10025818]|jgi:predicted DNA binding protein|uniref:helix-turn-helix domain-containing protein n=1 Tax=Salinirubellus TaxID=2162630 RepID=UPI0030CD9B4E
MILAEFVVDSPILGEVLRRVPDCELRWEETCTQPDGPTQMLVWVTSDDFEAVNTAIEDDDSARNPSTLVDLDERRLYRVDLTELGRTADLLPEFMEVGGVLEEAIGTRNGWWCRARFPDRTAYQHVYRFCRDHEIAFEFRRLFESTPEGLGEGTVQSMLTEGQREALTIACEEGYFDVPRRITLVDLADRLGISDTAASQRLRRAHSAVCAYLLGSQGSNHARTPQPKNA